MDAVTSNSSKGGKHRENIYLAITIRDIHKEIENVSYRMANDNVQEYQTIKRLTCKDWLTKFERYCEGLKEQKRKQTLTRKT